MSEKTRPGPEQRDRARRERAAALHKPTTSDLDAALRQPPHHRPTGWRRKGPDCGDCPPSSLSRCRWDGYRNLWAHDCGYTITEEELQEALEALQAEESH